MRIINNTLNNLSHFDKDTLHFLGAGQQAEIPYNIAKIWLKIDGVEKYATPEDLEAIKKENEELKKQIEEKPAKAATKTETKQENEWFI